MESARFVLKRLLHSSCNDEPQIAPSKSNTVCLPSHTNLLHVSIEIMSSLGDQGSSQPVLCAASADRRLTLIKLDPEISIFRSLTHVQDSPILSCVVLPTHRSVTISCGMSGQVIVYDHAQNRILDERRDHGKYVVKVVTDLLKGQVWVATSGWDGKVLLYQIASEEDGVHLGSPVATINLPTNPESLLFLEHPDTGANILLITRRDSTFLHYYRMPLPNSHAQDRGSSPIELELLGKQNLAPHSNAWIAFSPSSIALCPTDPTFLAVATTAVPHMKLILVRLLFPTSAAAEGSAANPMLTQAAQARQDLAVQDREEVAIQVHVNTWAPQTPYSTPQVVWRPDGTGVWVNGDDGIVRGLEAKTGKVVATLRDGHEAGSKIRTIWCGIVQRAGEREEWMASGGFDRRLIIWRPPS